MLDAQESASHGVFVLREPEGATNHRRMRLASSGIPAASGRKRMSRKYEIHSGRRVVKTVLSSSPLQAAIDYVHTFGSAKEITILGPDTVSWRGARFVGVPVPTTSS